MADLTDYVPTVGSGPKSADDLSYDAAADAFQAILDGEPHPTTVGAYFLANRWKRNTPEELAGFLDAMRERSVATAAPDADPVDCGAAYDGKTETALVGVAAGLVAAAAGTPVAVHSAGRLPASHGATYRDVLEALGVQTALTPEESAAMLDATGFGFYDARRFNPGVHELRELREATVVRSFVNTIETLADPADAASHIGSFYHLPFAKRLVATLERSERVAFDRVLLFQGVEGYDGIRPGETVGLDWRDGDAEQVEVATPIDGADYGRDDLAVEDGDLGARSAELTRAVLAGDRDGPVADAVAVNAAVRLFADGVVEELEEGVAVARETMDAGEPLERLAALEEYEAVQDRGGGVTADD